MKILISGGGTGGHIYPALTIIEAIRDLEPAAEFLYVGTKQGLEKDIVPRENIPFETMDLLGFERKISLENLRRGYMAFKGLLKARNIVESFRPNVAIGTGGYVCGPILFTASLMGAPSLIQEQNAVAGVTNRILSKVVTKIALGNEAAKRFFPSDKSVYTGNPIRKSVTLGDKKAALKTFGFTENLPTLLVTGGSRGAKSINEAMVYIVKTEAEKKRMQILLVTGKYSYDEILNSIKEKVPNIESLPHIKIVPYLYNMPEALSMADIVVMRAGAIALAEIAAIGKPAILVPYPFATGNHQEANARAFVEKRAAKMILNKDLNAEILLKNIEEIIFDESLRAAMGENMKSLGKPQAATDIAKLALSIAK